MEERDADRVIRVESERLDQLIAAVGELGVVQGAISRLLEKARAGAGAAELTVEAQKVQRSFERSVGAVRASALDARMVPLRRVFARLVELGRTLAAAQSKAIVWSVDAADAEVDKPIADGLGEALAHWIEYLVEIQGGTASGGVALGVGAWGCHHVSIEIHDDERGLRSMSGSDDVSEFDRRLSALRARLRPLGGLIEVGELGSGSRLRVTVPITLAMVGVLLVSVGGRAMALPLASVTEVVRFQASRLRTIDDRDAFDLRGQWLKVARLGELLGLPRPVENSEQHLVVVSSGSRRIGLVVERALGQQSVLQRPLGRSLGGVRAIAGAADLAGDGQLILVIDPAAILEELAPDPEAGKAGAA